MVSLRRLDHPARYPKPLHLHFALERETKGALRYQELGADGKPVGTDQGAAVGTLYLRKRALNGATHPDRLHVSIEKAQ
jgi:hypothetical protein